MNFKAFIGIDVSKSHLDISIYGENIHCKLDNNERGFEEMIEWVCKHTHCSLEQVLFAFEHTGLYSLSLSIFLNENQYVFAVIPGLELKRSLGMRRGKNDKVDARAIAEYVYEKREKIKPYVMPDNRQLQLQRLLSYRERLVKERAAFKGRFKEYKSILKRDDHQVLFASHQRMIELQNEEIKKVEDELYRLIEEDPELSNQFKLINSIKGVGPQTALLMIILTQGFKSFNEWRKFASYSGIAPFPYESGTMIRKKKVSHLANKRIKALLTCCAGTAIQFNPEMKLYYQRRISEGKNEMSTLNIVRNKLLSRIFAVVQRGTPYVETYKFAA
ncbi:IS110 family transposase [Marinoscillum furvescens]|uniref:Transposase IS116/IS110/IS902 family protein n=1 Tax=Marinoscillum furvescens DSM 4134 TaxID=1122208 RepID=A0A3D9KVF0_MARFU|nr:transposase [Marinoscillum furvescens]RED91100.1 transposase IS116/IS110/IS902 family protein [Marinoscillum furvescens DSM 4134]